MDESPFYLKSYESHRTHFDDYLPGGKQFEHALTWLRKDSIDYWRHERMYQKLLPFLRARPGARWLTVGDGRLGSDARYLAENGAIAHATDLSDHLLKVAAEKNLIREYSAQNCESLKFPDNSFDYCLCKESFHHFPRPWIAVHEMLRVSKEAVILIEPQDPRVDQAPLQKLFLAFTTGLKKILGKSHQDHQFENSGNYVYTMSKRETDKAALGIGLRWTAYFEINDFYTSGVEREKAEPGNRLFKKVRLRLGISNFLTALGLRPGHLLICVIFKTAPDEALQKALWEARFELHSLPKNPYL